MRATVLLVTLLSTGCVLQLAPSGSPDGVPGPRASVRVASSAKPVTRDDMLGIYAATAGDKSKGVWHYTPCTSLAKYTVRAGAGPRDLEIDVDNVRSFPVVPYGYTRVKGTLAEDGKTIRLDGVFVAPGPDGQGTVDLKASMDLTYHPDRLAFTGISRHERAQDQKVVLVLTDYPAVEPACPPMEGPRPAKTQAPATPKPSPLPSLAPDAVVVTIARRGGRCSYGGCDAETIYRADGSFTRRAGQEPLVEGQIDVDAVTAVRQEIARADFAAIKAKPFTGDCPPVYDGQEVTYTFKAANGDEKLPGCTYALDPALPLFVAAEQLETLSYGK